MTVHETAVMHAIHAQLPEWALGSQGLDLRTQIFRRCPIQSIGREALNRDEVSTNHVVDPKQFLNE
jgi:hypothetical protein